MGVRVGFSVGSGVQVSVAEGVGVQVCVSVAVTEGWVVFVYGILDAVGIV